jgi:hypothetical protein
LVEDPRGVVRAEEEDAMHHLLHRGPLHAIVRDVNLSGPGGKTFHFRPYCVADAKLLLEGRGREETQNKFASRTGGEPPAQTGQKTRPHEILALRLSTDLINHNAPVFAKQGLPWDTYFLRLSGERNHRRECIKCARGNKTRAPPAFDTFWDLFCFSPHLNLPKSMALLVLTSAGAAIAASAAATVGAVSVFAADASVAPGTEGTKRETDGKIGLQRRKEGKWEDVGGIGRLREASVSQKVTHLKGTKV